MIKVCENYCGSTILLAEFEKEEEANEFMKHNYILFYADELDNAEEDEIIYPNEMFIDTEEIPFCEPINPWEMYNLTEEQWGELPF